MTQNPNAHGAVDRLAGVYADAAEWLTNADVSGRCPDDRMVWVVECRECVERYLRARFKPLTEDEARAEAWRQDAERGRKWLARHGALDPSAPPGREE